MPRAGRVLDLGCGHGAVRAVPGRDRSRAGGHGRRRRRRPSWRRPAGRPRHAGLPVHFVHAAGGALPPGPWDAITVVDVLYLLGPGGGARPRGRRGRAPWPRGCARGEGDRRAAALEVRAGPRPGDRVHPGHPHHRGRRAWRSSRPTSVEATMAGAGLAVDRLPLGQGSLAPAPAVRRAAGGRPWLSATLLHPALPTTPTPARPSSTTRYFDVMATQAQVHWWYRARRALVAELLAGRVAPGARVIDVGCGTGDNLGALEEIVGRTGRRASSCRPTPCGTRPAPRRATCGSASLGPSTCRSPRGQPT